MKGFINNLKMLGKSPSELTKKFMTDFTDWNTLAWAASKQERESGKRTGKAMAFANESYKEVIVKYCEPGYKYQPISLGSRSAYDPEKHSIVAEEIDGNLATVHTERVESNCKTINEFKFKKNGRRWYLTGIEYVDDQERYQSL